MPGFIEYGLLSQNSLIMLQQLMSNIFVPLLNVKSISTNEGNNLTLRLDSVNFQIRVIWKIYKNVISPDSVWFSESFPVIGYWKFIGIKKLWRFLIPEFKLFSLTPTINLVQHPKMTTPLFTRSSIFAEAYSAYQLITFHRFSDVLEVLNRDKLVKV